MVTIRKFTNNNLFSLLVHIIIIFIGYKLSCKFIPKSEKGKLFCDNPLYYFLFFIFIFIFIFYIY